MQITHYMGAFWHPEVLVPGQCTVRRGGIAEQGDWWMLWFCVTREDNGKPIVAAIPINPGGGFIENGPGGKTWGIEYVDKGSHEWRISPSVNILSSELTHPGANPDEKSIWHQELKLVNVPDDEQWTGGGTQGRRVRWIQPIGRRGALRVYWDTVEYKDGKSDKYANSCPNAQGEHRSGAHDTDVTIGTMMNRTDDDLFGHAKDYPAEKWPTVCEHCNAPVPEGIPLLDEPEQPMTTGTYVWGRRSLFQTTLWNTPSGKIEVADAWWATPEGQWHMYSHDAGQCPYWDNCDGRHLRIKLPDGTHWDLMSRASNCSKKDDRTHRCWVVSGSVEGGTLTVGKGGPTCEAGAGSIQTERYHGMIANGVLSP